MMDSKIEELKQELDMLQKTNLELELENHALRQKVKEYRYQSYKLHEVQQLAAVGSWQLSLISGKIQVSKSLNDLLCIDGDRIQNWSDIKGFIHPEDQFSFNRWVMKIIKGKKKKTFCHRIMTEDQTIKYVEHSCKTFYSSTGISLSVIGIIKDVSDIKNYQSNLEKAKEKAESASKIKSIFLANMSHEIRTPINAILGHTQILGQDSNLRTEHLQKLKLIGQSSEYLLNLINDVLDMSKIEAGKMKLTNETFDFKDLIEDIHALFKPVASRKRLKFEVDFFNLTTPYIYADQRKIKQTILNLLSNAFKFTKEGAVEIGVRFEESLIVVTIDDSGIGVKDSERDRIFMAFEQGSKGEPIRQGTGLGLALCREFARLMGGDVVLERTQSRGARFVFTFKYFSGNETDIEGDDLSETKILGLTMGHSGKKILLISDFGKEAEDLEEVLLSTGFEVKNLMLESDSLKMLEDWIPNVIIINESDINDYDLLELKQVIEQNFEVPILVISTSKESPLGTFQDEVFFMRKPFRKLKLLEVLKGILSIEYLYNVKENSQCNLLTEFSKKRIKRIPQEISSAFNEAAVLGDIDKLLNLVDEIDRYDRELAKCLYTKVKSFNLEEIQQVFS